MFRITLIFMFIMTFIHFSYSQSESDISDKKMEIGLNVASISGDGLFSEITFLRPIYNGWYAAARVGTNFRYANSIRLGIRYDVLQYKKLNFRMGLDYGMTDLSLARFAQTDRVDHDLEIPFDLSYRLSNRVSINASASGVIKRFELGGSERPLDNSFFNSIRLGISHKF